MPRQGKESVTTTSSLNGPVFRPEFRKHPWRCSSSWEDRMLRQSSSFRTFTSCSKLLSPSPNMLLFSCYWALDTGHTRLFPCPPATATFSFMSKSQELVPSSEQFYHAGSPQQRGAVVTFSFTTWLDERDSIPYPSSLGQVDKKKKKTIWSQTGHKQDIAFPLTGNSLDHAYSDEMSKLSSYLEI